MNRQLVAGLGIVACAAIVVVGLLFGPPVARTSLRSPSLSGELPEGSTYWVVRWPLALCGPQHGQIAVFRAPPSTGDLAGGAFVKRVAAVAGDRVEVREGRVIRNGETIEEPWVDLSLGGGPDLAETTVPAGHLLVLGDLRGKSYDGRSWGMLDRDLLEGLKLPCRAAP
ncbi:MAG: signal peptidase I [Myxococcota bacterium]